MYHPHYQALRSLTIKSFVVLFLLYGCTSPLRHFDTQLKEGSLKNSFHGLIVVEAETGKTLLSHNGERYFTPASTTKLVTWLTALEMLPDRLPALKYSIQQDTILFEGTGDPTWLHPHFKDSTSLTFLKKHNTILWYPGNSNETGFGPGWAWEDYDTYFSPEKGVLPLYGNVVSVIDNGQLEITPSLFASQVIRTKKPFRRDLSENQFYVDPNTKDSLQIPFITSNALTLKLLEEAIGKKVGILNKFPDLDKKVYTGISTDSVCKQMLFESDNFLAEQLLLMASSTLSDTLSTQKAISHMLDNQLANLDEEPRWVDGSGLSRYNLFTPRSMVQVLQKLQARLTEERLLHLMPMWNASGTTDVWHDELEAPYIFAKSGSLGNNYNLCGFLRTKKGKWLIFSFMNNHFKVPSAQVRSEIFTTLTRIREKY